MPSIADRLLTSWITGPAGLQLATTPELLAALRDGTLASSARVRLERALLQAAAEERDSVRVAGHLFDTTDLLTTMAGTLRQFLAISAKHEEAMAWLAASRILPAIPVEVLWMMMGQSKRVRAEIARHGDESQIMNLGWYATATGRALEGAVLSTLRARSDDVLLRLQHRGAAADVLRALGAPNCSDESHDPGPGPEGPGPRPGRRRGRRRR